MQTELSYCTKCSLVALLELGSHVALLLFLFPIVTAAFAVTPFLGDITPFSKPGRRFGNYVTSLGRSFTVVNIVGSRPAFRVSSVVIRSVFTNGLSIQT